VDEVTTASLLEVRDLRTYFFTHSGVVKAVDGVSYDVNEGETIALVGESGCGKTVSALSLLRLHPLPQGRIVGGEVVWIGRDLLRLSDQELRRVRGKDIAMIFQEPMTSLNPVLTIGRQIGEALELHQGLERGAAREKCLSLLQAVAISDPERRIDQYPHQLSGGMRQRVMVALALSCNPKLLIADEPTTSIDVTIQAQLLELIASLTQQAGVAAILITHNLGVVARHAQRVNVMYAGHIVEKATAVELYTRPRHPYTIGLLRSVPRLDEERKKKLIPIPGYPPALDNLPPGCAFHPRCFCAAERCSREMPALRTLSNGHEVACWQEVEV